MDRKKKLLIGAVMGVAVFAAVFASAASLNVSTETLGAGGTDVSSCDTTGVKATYTTSYAASAPAGYKVDTITIDEIAEACRGLEYKVQATTADGTSLTAATGTLDAFAAGSAETNTVDVTPGSVLDAAEVEGIYVVISG